MGPYLGIENKVHAGMKIFWETLDNGLLVLGKASKCGHTQTNLLIALHFGKVIKCMMFETLY